MPPSQFCVRSVSTPGGSNVQFAVNPKDGRLVVIEMNPRVSRSSALASKATGFPIAKVAAKLAVGYTLDELKNEITGGRTPASFEPTIDYVVVKTPRFAFEKFPKADKRLTTQMKSVGEVMAIGRTFQEALQKALRGLETGKDGLNEISTDRATIHHEISEPGPDRLWYLADASVWATASKKLIVLPRSILGSSFKSKNSLILKTASKSTACPSSLRKKCFSSKRKASPIALSG